MKIIIKRVKSRFRQCLPPYEDYRSSGPYNIGKRRYMNISSFYKNTCVAYARYLWEVAHRRKVRKGYEIDHIDGDCTNDTIYIIFRKSLTKKI